MSYKPVWNPPATLECAKIIIHLQNVLMTGIGYCMQDIKIEDYEKFKKDIIAIPFVAGYISESCDVMLSLKTRKKGKKPLWFEWGEDVKYFCKKVRDAIGTIERERRRNEWEVISTRLEEMNQQCADWQNKILKIMPEEKKSDGQIYVSQKSVIEWAGLVKTLELGGDYALTAEGFRYRKKWD